ncbi:MAG: amino acid adenylation domain-containing protein [Rhizonema sp. NSF051]|nr:amino acid adenylation domain-containing protein [Rhizonema sp. NSF051]
MQASCVIAREDIPGNKRLVAYVVLQLEVTPTITELRQFLKAKLPDYMVPSGIVILDSLPLTPNGKIYKSALPSPESRGGIEVSLVAPRTPIEEILALIWAEVLRVPLVGIHDNFFELGGDSILSIQIISRAKQAGLQLSVKQLFAHQTIAELATVAVTSRDLQLSPEQGLVTGKIPLTPIQHWFFEQNLPQPHHFNQSFLLCIPSNFQPGLLKQVWQQLLLHHDALRLRFTQSQSGWQQIHSDPSEHIAFSFIDLSTLPETEYLSAIVATATSLQASLNLEENLVQVAYFWLGVDKKARLLIIIHHLVVDGVSWRILLEDLLTAYQQLESSKAIQLPAKTTSFKDWGQHLTKYAQTEVFKSEIAYWLRGSRAAVASIPIDCIVGANSVATANTVSVSLNEAETLSLLLDFPKAYKTQINDVLLTALVLVLSKWTHSDSVLFNLEGHGREDIIEGVDLSRTVGWFTTIFPVHVELSTTDKQYLGTALKSVKEQLRAIPHKGIGYGLLRYLSSDPEIAAQLQTQTLAEISFNYLGQFTQVLNTSSVIQLATEPSGQSHSLQGKRAYLLDINAIITNERLQIDWTYSTNVHQQSTIENIALEFVATLRELITHCLSPDNGGYTPTDFPLVKFDQRELDQVLANIELKPQDSKTHSTSVEDIYPLSPMQQGMLFESLYAPNSGVYFEILICTLKGNVDVPAFQAAWQQVVARHSIFRTAFIWESLNQPLQVVYRQVPVTLLTYDWRELSVEQQKQQLEVFLDSERQQGLPLSQAPLMRLHLIQLDRDTYEFVWSSHHLLLDGWSSALVFKELLNFYQAFSQGERLPLQPTVSYRNYIAWLQQQDVANSVAFWRQKLQGFHAPTPITVDRLLPRDNGNESFGEQFLQLTLPSSAAVQSFARQHQLTINNLVQATWALLLCRYSRETDVVFGMTVSGRPPDLMGVESMVGLLINTVPMRVKISQETKLLDLLKDLQAQIVESEQFSYSSLIDIQGFSDVPRGMPLFESIVVFENYPVDSAVLQDNGSFSLSNLRAFGRTNYPLTVVVSPGEQLLVKVSYDSGRFDHATISRMLGHFETMLCAIVADPNQHVMKLPMLTELEQQQLLVEWNDTLLEYPQDSCIPELFEAQVKRTPDAVAVVYENQQLTYTELNARANQLAHYLQQRGVGAEVVVALYVERSLELIVGMLGILKAGAAYLPLETTYPTERLALMLEDAKVAVLLTQQQLVKTFPEYTVEVICLDTDWDKIAHQSQENLQSGVKPENLAYVLFTSGSTGQPKGVAVEHRQLCNYLNAINERLDLSISHSFAYLSTIAADLGNTTIFPSLCNGGCLHIVSLDRATNPEALADYFCCHPIDCFKIVPSHLAALLTSSRPEQILPRQSLILGGDVCSWPLLTQIRQLTSECQIFNHYGPTEATVGVLTYAIAPGHTERSSHTVPIGCPIANTLIYILDSNLQPVPIGVPGELHIGGAGLARGYLNRPQLTLEKFISNPFSTDLSSRLYKTGDLARYLPDGNIEYLGRIDHQVKIRGFRIELGEIETVLSQHPQIHSVVVIARVDLPGDQSLVAYVVPHHDFTPTISSLRQFLKAKLPDYMVPTALVILESLPMTPNGKIDRRALRVPSNSSTSDTFVSPRNTVELQLMQIWSKILKVDNVSVKDNFFDLGGHSLLAVYLMAQIKQQFGKDIPLATLFQHPTIEQLASVVQLDMPASGCSPLVPIQSIGSKPPLFCLPGAGGNPFYLYNLARCLGPDQPFYSLQVNHLERLVPITRVEDIAAYYIHAIQALQPLGPYFLAGHSFGGKVVFEMAQQLLSQGQVVALVAILDTTAPSAQEKQIDDLWDDAMWLIEFARTLKIVFAKDLDLDTEKLRSLAPDEQLKYVLEYLKMLDIVPYDADSTYLKQLLQAFKADINAEYVPQQTQKLPITLLRARETDLEEPVSASLSEILQDSAWGWSAFSSVPVDVQFVSGNHITMMTPPHVQDLAERLNACILQAMKKMGLPETLN